MTAHMNRKTTAAAAAMSPETDLEIEARLEALTSDVETDHEIEAALAAVGLDGSGWTSYFAISSDDEIADAVELDAAPFICGAKFEESLARHEEALDRSLDPEIEAWTLATLGHAPR